MSYLKQVLQMYNIMKLKAPPGPLNARVDLPASKSVSNRLLIIHALCKENFHIENLSLADDTRILNELLQGNFSVEDCGAGGTTVRFLLALRCLQGKETFITGSERLVKRPVAALVDSLRALGAQIDYAGKEGFLPLKLGKSILQGGVMSIRADISSQFISALLLVAPYMRHAFELHLSGTIVSFPYIEMTAALMKYFGADVSMEKEVIAVRPSVYKPRDFEIPADWSAAAFFYAMAALRPGTEMRLLKLGKDEFQGDSALMNFMTAFGVDTSLAGADVLIHSKGIEPHRYLFDFTNTPDLAQAFAVMAAVSNSQMLLKGLSTLKEKETDRLYALKTELEKAGAEIHITEDSLEVLRGIKKEGISGITFNTYTDHRMVMALSMLSLCGEEVMLLEPHHVTKSFPSYFDVLTTMGFEMRGADTDTSLP